MLALLAAAAIALGAANPPGTFIDATGDSGSAPDITKIVVSGGTAGRLVFTISFATPYGPSSSLYVYLDTDRSASTGGPNGADYRIGPGGLEVWDSSAKDFEPSGATDATFSVAPGGRALELSTAAGDVGNPVTVNAVVQSIDGAGGSGRIDNAVAIWSKTSSGGLTITNAHQTAAKAGTVWALTIRASGAPSGSTAAVTCAGASGKVRLISPNHLATVTPGGDVTALCVFRVPKTLKKKKLRSVVTVVVGTKSTTKTFTTTAK